MPKNKPPVPRKSSTAAEPDIDALAQDLADLAVAANAQTAGAQDGMRTALRQALRKKHDEVLYGAIELARFADPAASALLRAEVEEAAATWQVRREGAPVREIDAFMVPLFVRSTGGLEQAALFQDDAAFDALVNSFTAGQLESADARVVLMRHAYTLDEVDRIAFGDLQDMLREAAASMTEKKHTPTSALERSIHGWGERSFGPQDDALELRFLLGFALKGADDPFYRVPDDEAAADAYFSARMARYQAWTAEAAPLVQRCLAGARQDLHIDFLYQDLFFGAKEQGVAEWAMLAALSGVNAALDGIEPGACEAEVGAIEGDEGVLLRISLRRDGAVFASVDKELDLAADVGVEVAELVAALEGLGFSSVREVAA